MQKQALKGESTYNDFEWQEIERTKSREEKRNGMIDGT
jgi:hypothetical protein